MLLSHRTNGLTAVCPGLELDILRICEDRAL